MRRHQQYIVTEERMAHAVDFLERIFEKRRNSPRLQNERREIKAQANLTVDFEPQTDNNAVTK